MNGTDFQVVNGAFRATPASRERHVIAERVVLTVYPDGRTACFARSGHKFPIGGDHGRVVPPRKVTMFVGEIDGVRAYVCERNGKMHVILTRQSLEP